MSQESGVASTRKWAVLAAGVGLVYVLVRNRQTLLGPLRRVWTSGGLLPQRQIEVINSVQDPATQWVLNELKKHCQNFKVLGFDCEWITVGGSRRPVALLQLSSHQGLCALFRLCHMKQIPKDLRELLEDDSVIKVGVAPQEDAMKLSHDYGVGVASTLDLRFLCVMAGHKPEGLGKLSDTHLNYKLDKHWRLVCSNWEAKQLEPKQLNYAANDALVAVAIYRKLCRDLEPKYFWQRCAPDDTSLRNKFEPFLDVDFTKGFTLNPTGSGMTRSKGSAQPQGKKWMLKKQPYRQMATRSKDFYDNCLLQAPDGELLCTIDRRKASWYINQNLGTQISEEPFTVRLNFEPAGRAVGDVGRYYQTPKENQCVVCGERDAYIRKNVVPREYRKHFPMVMKSHTSHDVLLLCPTCHQLSNISDLRVRNKLATQCQAPFKREDGSVKYHDDPELKRVQSAGKALLHHGAKIPAPKVAEMQKTLLEYYTEQSEVTEDLLRQAASVEYRIENSDYCQHGERVVQQYREKFGGLVELERLWREHFLHTMQPQFLPELWNVNHNADRLEVRASEGRVDKADLLVAGLDAKVKII
ncbi:exonuclease 3'-5' domain-containing protein 2 [Drosophila eugracilis]|uniref:exonuclease 3'-5' domain-containing protein 2 n=1 Tax=Drosophila eugracilis TaxID=29029 RepID=UPI001BD98C0D|nr:exonuclease 3'-5' domain-containing protein 2 [Drosophila eugracilis]